MPVDDNGRREHGSSQGIPGDPLQSGPPSPDPTPIRARRPARPVGGSKTPNYAARRTMALVCVVAIIGALFVGFTSLLGDDDSSAAPTTDESATDPSDGSATSGAADDDTNATEGETPESGATESGTAAPASDPASDGSGPAAPAEIHHGFQDDVLYVALYGHPGSNSLGILGQEDRTPEGAVALAAEVASTYAEVTNASNVVPTFEIIASVASSELGDGDYSNEASIDTLRPWVDAAGANGQHVILDLQSGREAFPSQILEFEELLLEPHVGVALDPEWRVPPDDRPEGGRVGFVTAAEVNDTIAWLDNLVEENDLPRKMLIVHQFEDQMIRDKENIQSTDNVQVVLHMDGFGPLRLKRETYDRVTTGLDDHWETGWKNFYDEDDPTPTPAEVMVAEPQPIFVSYQ